MNPGNMTDGLSLAHDGGIGWTKIKSLALNAAWHLKHAWSAQGLDKRLYEAGCLDPGRSEGKFDVFQMML